jgi:hypothetical protein
MTVDDSLWYVKLADGDVERFTLDQLDDAFQNGQIDENTMVLAAGSDQWLKLSDLLGLSDATPPPPPPSPMPHMVQTLPAPPPSAYPVPVTTRPQMAMAGTHPLATMRPPPQMPILPGAKSVRPVTFDLRNQFDVGDVSYPARSRKGWVVGGLGTAIALGAAAFFVLTRMAGSASANTTPAPVFAAAVAPPPPAYVPPAPPATPQTTTGGPSSVMDPTMRLTDDQKAKLLEAEKKGKQLHASKSHGGGGGGGGSASAPRSKSTTFTTTGSKYDPLNSSM